MDTIRHKDLQIETIQAGYDELLEQLKVKEDRIVDLEFELFSADHMNEAASMEKTDDEKQSSFWTQKISEKNTEIERLEGEVRKRTCDLQGIVNKELWEKNREIERIQQKYAAIIENKDLEIESLEKDIGGKDLQLNILKDKISELGVHVNLPSNLVASSQNRSRTEAVSNLSGVQEQLRLCMEERKYLKQQVEELKQQLKNTPERENSKQIEDLKIELKESRDEFNRCEKMRRESNEICAVLSNRLEELAQFLDSLLKQKSVLGFLGSKQNNKLRQIVDQSLDLSRTLSLSISLNPDQSLMQLSNISNLLNSTRQENESIAEFLAQGEEHTSVLSIIPSNITLTYQSHLRQSEQRSIDNVVSEQAAIINVLREQVETLKHEIDIRDRETDKKMSKPVENDQDFVEAIIDLSSKSRSSQTQQKILENLLEDKKLNNTSTTLKNRTDNQSESESWSEPDRNVSMARIGLLEESLKPHPNVSISRRSRSLLSTESTEESNRLKSSKKSSYTENRQTIIALHEQVCQLETLVKEKETYLLEADVAHNDTKKQLKKERSKTEQLTQQRDALLQQITETEKRVKSVETKKCEVEKRLDELQATIEQLLVSKQMLESGMKQKDKDTQEAMNALEQEKTRALEATATAEKIAEDAKRNLKESETKLQTMREEIRLVEQNIRQETEERLSQAEQDFDYKLKEIENQSENRIAKIVESSKESEAKYEAEYVKRSEIDKLKNQLKELENIRQIAALAEKKIEILEQTEFALKTNLEQRQKEHQAKIHTLHSELDAANLHYSEVVLHKSRLSNEKVEFESQIRDFREKETDFAKQVTEFQTDFRIMKESFRKQLTNLQKQKNEYEVRISELEATNAELHNRLIRIQTGRCGDHVYSSSAPSSPSKIIDLFNNRSLPLKLNIAVARRRSENSGYTSEEVGYDSGTRSGFERIHPFNVADLERHNANPSPDLGIDSDHGRFSSLEANINLPRPFLQSLEITRSMNNLLEVDPHHQPLTCSKFITINSPKH